MFALYGGKAVLTIVYSNGVKKYAERIVRTSHRLSQLVDQLTVTSATAMSKNTT